MKPELQRRVQRYGWDKATDFYEEYWKQQLKPAACLLLELANFKKGERVIDIACGTGLVSLKAAEQIGKSGFLLGTDISEKMVEMATKKASLRELGQVQFERMDAENLLVADGTFDVALCALGLMYVPDPVKALQEMHRVLKPGGRAVISVWGRRSQCGWSQVFQIVDKRVASEVCPMFFDLGNPGSAQAHFTLGGFHNIVTERINTILHYNADEEACGAAFLGGPVALAYSRFSESTKKEACEEYIASIKPFQKSEGYQVPGEFVVAKGYK